MTMTTDNPNTFEEKSFRNLAGCSNKTNQIYFIYLFMNIKKDDMSKRAAKKVFE